MSIWSRSHRDLAKMAKSLQDSNSRAKERRAQQDSHTPHKLERCRSLSPGMMPQSGDATKAERPRSVSPRAVSVLSLWMKKHPEKTNLVTAKLQSLSGNGWSASGSGGHVSGTVESETPVPRVTTPRLMITNEDGSSFDAFDDSGTSSEHSDMSVNMSTVKEMTSNACISDSGNQEEKQTLGPGDSQGEKLVCDKNYSARQKGDNKLLSDTIDYKLSTTTTKKYKLSEEGNVPKSKTPLNVLCTERQTDMTRTESPEMVKYQCPSPAVHCPSPRLAARSPELLRKLMEVTSTISSKKTINKRELHSPSPDYGQALFSPPNMNKLHRASEDMRPVLRQKSSILSPDLPETMKTTVLPAVKHGPRFQKESSDVSQSFDGSVNNDSNDNIVNTETTSAKLEDTSFHSNGEQASPSAEMSLTSSTRKFTADVCNNVPCRPIAIRIDTSRSHQAFPEPVSSTLNLQRESGTSHWERKFSVTGENHQEKCKLAASTVDSDTSSSIEHLPSDVHYKEQRSSTTSPPTYTHQQLDISDTHSEVHDDGFMTDRHAIHTHTERDGNHRTSCGVDNRQNTSSSCEAASANSAAVQTKFPCPEELHERQKMSSRRGSATFNGMWRRQVTEGINHDDGKTGYHFVAATALSSGNAQCNKQEETTRAGQVVLPHTANRHNNAQTTLNTPPDSQQMSGTPDRFYAVSPSIAGSDFTFQSATTDNSPSILDSASDTEMRSVSAPVSLDGCHERNKKSSRSDSKLATDELFSHVISDVRSQDHLSTCSSCLESFLSCSESGSESDDNNSIMLTHLLSFLHTQRHKQPSVNRKRLRKLLRVLRHYDKLPSLTDSESKDFTKTISEMQHLCVRLCTQLEHHQHHHYQQYQQQQQQQQQRQQQQDQQHQQKRQQKESRDKWHEQISHKQQLKVEAMQSVHTQQYDEHPRFMKGVEKKLCREMPGEHQAQSRQKLTRHQSQQGQHLHMYQKLQRQKCREQPKKNQEPINTWQKQMHSETTANTSLPVETQEPLHQPIDLRKANTSTDRILKTKKYGTERSQKMSPFKRSAESVAKFDEKFPHKASQNTDLLDSLAVEGDILGAENNNDASRVADTVHLHDATKDLSDIGAGAIAKEEKEEEGEKKGEVGGEELRKRQQESEAGDSLTPDEKTKKLDEDFNKLLADLKVHVLRLPHKSDRRKCAAWIKKACSSQVSEAVDKKRRNTHCRLLLQMLQAGKIQRPFDQIPEYSHCPSLPSHKTEMLAAEVEDKYRAEKVRLQHDHNAVVQKIWDQKNSEVEDVKNHHLGRIKTMEETIKKLEDKAETLTKQTNTARESKDKEILQLAENSSLVTQRYDYEKMMADMESVFMEEKSDLQTQHAHELHQLMEDTNTRLQRLEDDYTHRTSTSTETLKDLESQVKELTLKLEHTMACCSRLQQDKDDLQKHVEALTTELDRQHHRNDQLEKTHQKKLVTVGREMKTLGTDADTCLALLRQQHFTAAAKASGRISELEEQVESLKKSLSEMDQHWSKEMKDRELAHQEDLQRIDNFSTKQIGSMKKEARDLQDVMMPRLSSLTQRLRERENELLKQTQTNKEQALATEKALKELKQQTEAEHVQHVASLKHKMTQLEEELAECNQTSDEERKEFAKQLEDEEQKYQYKRTELKRHMDDEKAELLQKAETAKGQFETQRERELEECRGKHRIQLKALHSHLKETQEEIVKNTEDLLTELTQLTEQVEQVEEKRKEELLELNTSAEEDKLRILQEHKIQIAKYGMETELQTLEIQKTHWTKMGTLLENVHLLLTNEKLSRAGKGNAEESDISISSLNSRINRLQQKADMLQEELTLPIKIPLSLF